MNKIEPNYFCVNRGLLYSDRWLSEPFTRGQAWVDIFGLAQHTKGFFRVRGIKIEVKRGQLAYSQLTLAKRWQWSRGKVKRYLNELENGGDIIQQNNEITTLISVLKYDKWQGNNTTNRTTDGQQTDNRRDTYNNDKNDNNITHIGKSETTKEEIKQLSVIKPRKVVNNEVYNLLLWAEARRGENFKFANKGKQLKAIKQMKTAEISPEEIKERWEEMNREKFWQEKGFDFMNIANSFDKKR